MGNENVGSEDTQMITEPPSWFDVLEDAVHDTNAWIGWQGYFAEAVAGYAMSLFVYYRPMPSYFTPKTDALILAALATCCLLSATHSYFFGP